MVRISSRSSQARSPSRKNGQTGRLDAAGATETPLPPAPEDQKPMFQGIVPADLSALGHDAGIGGRGADEVDCVTAQGRAYLARAMWALVLLPYALLRAWNVYFVSPNQDVQHYFIAATGFVEGKTPYRDFPCEYPPGAIPFFALPRLFTADFRLYEFFFAAEMMVVDGICLWLLYTFAKRFAPLPSPSEPLAASRRPFRFAACAGMLAYVWMTGSLGYLAVERYDLLFGCMLLGFLTYGLSQGRRAQAISALLLSASIATKVVSVVLVPLWLVHLVHTHRAEQAERGHPPSLRVRDVLEATVRPLCIVLASLTLYVAPFYWAAGSEFFNFLAYHHGRGLQVESTFSSILMLLQDQGLTQVGTRFAYGAAEVTGPWVQSLANMAAPLTVALVLLVAWQAYRRYAALGIGDARGRAVVFVTATTATVALQMASNKVFSPQYMLWLAPLCGAVVALRAGRYRPAIVGLLVANALTSLVLFFYYGNLLRFERMGLALQLTRNALVLLAGMSLAEFDLPKAIRAKGRAFLEEMQVLASHRAMPAIAVLSAAFWVLLANFSETTANDIWIQLRSGEDIFRSRSVPYTEVYSAVVSGRPFIAHEWLCGVFFYVSTLVLGDAGLCVMTAIVALGIFVCMYYTFEASVRRSVWYLPLLLYSNYLVAFRVLARPHIFTIWAQAALILAVEQWRRKGGLRQLWWLIPMQILWINLHGAALFGPALMGMVTGLTFLFVLFPDLDTTNPRRYTFQDVRDGTLMTVALALACFVNPYGTRIVAFSVDLLGNEYAKSRVWEWTTPFLGMNTYYYWLWIWMAEVAVLWFGVLLRIRQRPVFDLSYAVLATYLGVRANRFMPDFALLSFPVVARSLHLACQQGFAAPFRVRRPWLELGLTTLLITNCVVYGYAHSQREHRPLPGWGYGGDMPYQEVDLLKRLKVRGTIYNEYSDGSLIINRLWPSIRPVLDSRIDLFPLDLVNDYDTAYVNPQAFANYIKRRNVNIVMLYKNRAQPGIVQMLETHPNWRRLSDTNNRLLYVTRDSLRRHGAAT